MKKISKARMRLLLELESIIGSECYNGNIQNWRPNGVFEGEGRNFRYPITFIDAKDNKMKRRHVDNSMPAQVAITGYYTFGANQLQIVRALDKVLSYLEANHNFKV